MIGFGTDATLIRFAPCVQVLVRFELLAAFVRGAAQATLELAYVLVHGLLVLFAITGV